MECPRCKEKMARSNSSGIATNSCLYCNGVWINKEKLEALLKKEKKSPSITSLCAEFHKNNEEGEHRNCPVCEEQKLDKVHTHGVELDFCHSCNGLFFDEGEIEKVLPISHKEKFEPGSGTYFATESLFWLLAGVFTGGC